MVPPPIADPQNLAATGPDWAAIGYDVFCPSCEYNLRGLIEPRCPECGYRFEWPEILDPAHRLHPYLFEHHPERNVWSYRRTFAGACRPKRFWTSLHLLQPSRPRRLLLYWLIGAVILLLVSPLLMVPDAIRVTRKMNDLRASQAAWMARYPKQFEALTQHWSPAGSPPLTYGDPAKGTQRVLPGGFPASTQAYLDTVYPSMTTWSCLKRDWATGIGNWRVTFPCWPFVPLVPLAWAWATAAALMLFQVSMRRSRLRPAHCLRCAVYCFDPMAWGLLLLLGGVLLIVVTERSNLFGISDAVAIRGAPWVIGATVVFGIWRLRAACQWYLRFTWPTATALATQVIALLAVFALLALLFPGVADVLFTSLCLT